MEDRCRRCGFAPEHQSQLEIHHQDLDRSNNKPPNLVTLWRTVTFCCTGRAANSTDAGPRGSRRPRKILKVDMLAAERHAATFKVISDATRLAMVACLARVGEVCVTDLTESFELFTADYVPSPASSQGGRSSRRGLSRNHVPLPRFAGCIRAASIGASGCVPRDLAEGRRPGLLPPTTASSSRSTRRCSSLRSRPSSRLLS